LEGEPGAGKTTLAINFLIEGVKLGQKTLYVTLSETRDELEMVFGSHGWSLGGIETIELERDIDRHSAENQYTVFESSDVELDETIQQIYAAAKRLRPSRVVIDSLSELRLLTQDSLRFRRELLGMKRFFSEIDATILMLDDRTLNLHEGLLQSIAHGVIRLERMATQFGSERRRLSVSKLRGSRFREGFHDYRIRTGGLEVYPRLVASEHRQPVMPGSLLSGIGNLDQLLGGGLDRGTSTILVGPSGSGKSTLSAMYAVAAAKKGERVEVYLFDENLGTYLTRDRSLGLGIQPLIDDGMITLRQIDPAEISPGEFTQELRNAVDQRGAQHLVIDSLNGFIQAMPGEQTLMVQVHEILSFMGQRSVTTVLSLAQHGLMGPGMTSAADLSYVADTLILLRFFEAFGELRQAISVVKKRTGRHERTVRQIQIDQGGVRVGEPLTNFRGVMTGVPHYVDREGRLLDGDER